MGGRGDSTVTPITCSGGQTIACWLADHGYVVYSIDYTLVTKTDSGFDLSVVGTNTVASASYSFKTSDIGSRLIQGTTSGGWHAGGYTVTSVTNGQAVLNLSPGKTGIANGNWTLLQTPTLWPVQWQDCDCFLRYLAEQAGVSTPGDPNRIVLMGQSSGAHLSGVVGLSKNNAFPTNCDHTSVKYKVVGVIAYSPPTDLISLWLEQDNAKQSARNLIGCIPYTLTCNPVGYPASIETYAAETSPNYVAFSGQGDVTVPTANAEETSTAFASLNPPVKSPFIVFGPNYQHPLDIYYYKNCASGKEPSPCGSAGMAFQMSIPYLQTWTAPQ